MITVSTAPISNASAITRKSTLPSGSGVGTDWPPCPGATIRRAEIIGGAPIGAGVTRLVGADGDVTTVVA